MLLDDLAVSEVVAQCLDPSVDVLVPFIDGGSHAAVDPELVRAAQSCEPATDDDDALRGRGPLALGCHDATDGGCGQERAGAAQKVPARVSLHAFAFSADLRNLIEGCAGGFGFAPGCFSLT